MSINGYGGGSSGGSGGTGGLEEETSQDIQKRLDAADTTKEPQEPPKKSKLQESLESLEREEGRGKRRGAEDLSPTEKVIQQTFPDPRISRIEFARDGSTGKLSEIYIEVRVSGDFIGDEWFWADYLQYFKLKVYLVPAVSGKVGYNRDFNSMPMYSDDIAFKIKDAGDAEWAKTTGQRQGTTFQFDPLSVVYFSSFWDYNNTMSRRPFSPVPIPSLQTDLSLRDTYTFERTLKISQFYHDKYLEKFSNAVVQPNTVAIVARTFFDIESFKDELLKGADAGILNPITDVNNGKWDFVDFTYIPRKSGPYPIITDVKRRMGYYLDADASKKPWDGTFSVNWLGDRKFYTTSDFKLRPGAPSFAYEPKKFNRTNVDNMILQSAIRRKTSTNRNK